MSGPGPLQSHDASAYETFYGLAQAPFTLSPDPQFLYLSESHDAAIRRILQSLRRREAFVVLSGDIGTGKTTLCRGLLQRLDRTTLSSLVLNPFLSVDELLRQALLDFGVVSRETAQRAQLASATTHDLATTLGDFLQTLAPLGASAVLVIDEAQHLSPRVLEELRVLSGIGSQDARLQIVLVGQPNLLDVLAAADMRQLDQRISLRAMLAPLALDDVQRYIAHRLTVAGESVSVMFEKSAVKRVHALSGGIPRVINLLCDRALMAGAERGVHEITPDLVDRAAEDISFRRGPIAADGAARRRIPGWAWGATALLLMVLATGLLAPLHRVVTTSPPALPPRPTPALATFTPPQVPADEPLTPGANRSPLPLPPGETPDDLVIERITP